jgi:hypothetical protein
MPYGIAHQQIMIVVLEPETVLLSNKLQSHLLHEINALNKSILRNYKHHDKLTLSIVVAAIIIEIMLIQMYLHR